MKTSFRILAFFFFAGTFLFLACKKDNIKNLSLSNRNPLWAIQIATANLSLDDLTGAQHDSILSKGTNAITFVNPVSFASPYAKDFFSLPNPSKNNTVSLTPAEISQFLSSGTITRSIADTILFPFANSELVKSVKIKSGTLNINFIHQFKQNAKISVSIPFLKFGLTSYASTFLLNYSGSVPVLSQNPIDLAGYTINLAYGGTTPQNKLAYTIKDTMTYLGNPLVSADNTSIDFIFSDLQFGDVDGNFGSFEFPVNTSSVNIDFFKRVSSAGLNLTDPYIAFTAVNSFGFPVIAKFPSFNMQTLVAGTVSVSCDTLINGISFVSPTVKGQSKSKSFTMSKTNSNIVDIVAQSPLNYNFEMRDSARLSPTLYTYFMTDSSHYNSTVDLRLPISGTYTGLILMDTVAVNFSAFANNKIDSLRIFATNKFPVSASIQGYILDNSGTVLDSIFNDRLLEVPPAVINNKGAITKLTDATLTSGISDAQFASLLMSKKIVFKIILKMPETLPAGVTTLKLATTSYLKVDLGAQVKGK